MNGYIAMYNGKKIEVYTDTSYSAQKQAAALFRLAEKNRYKVSVYRCVDAQGNQVTQVITS